MSKSVEIIPGTLSIYLRKIVLDIKPNSPQKY